MSPNFSDYKLAVYEVVVLIVTSYVCLLVPRIAYRLCVYRFLWEFVHKFCLSSHSFDVSDCCYIERTCRSCRSTLFGSAMLIHCFYDDFFLVGQV